MMVAAMGHDRSLVTMWSAIHRVQLENWSSIKAREATWLRGEQTPFSVMKSIAHFHWLEQGQFFKGERRPWKETREGRGEDVFTSSPRPLAVGGRFIVAPAPSLLCDHSGNRCLLIDYHFLFIILWM